MGMATKRARKGTKSRKLAVALQYAEGDRAPKVIASGAGEIAKRILDLAHEHNIPIRSDHALADILSQVRVGEQIPPETYKVVAEILAFLYKTDLKWRDRKRREHTAFKVGAKSTPVAVVSKKR